MIRLKHTSIFIFSDKCFCLWPWIRKSERLYFYLRNCLFSLMELLWHLFFSNYKSVLNTKLSIKCSSSGENLCFYSCLKRKIFMCFLQCGHPCRVGIQWFLCIWTCFCTNISAVDIAHNRGNKPMFQKMMYTRRSPPMYNSHNRAIWHRFTSSWLYCCFKVSSPV